MNTTRSLPVLRTLCSIAVLAAAAALPLNSEAATLTLYNAQHEQVVAALAKDFESLNRAAMAFLRLASIRLMLRRLCQTV